MNNKDLLTRHKPKQLDILWNIVEYDVQRRWIKAEPWLNSLSAEAACNIATFWANAIIYTCDNDHCYKSDDAGHNHLCLGHVFSLWLSKVSANETMCHV